MSRAIGERLSATSGACSPVTMEVQVGAVRESSEVLAESDLAVIRAAVSQMAEADLALKKAKTARQEAVSTILGLRDRYHVTSMDGPDGKVTITTARGRRILRKDLLRKYLDEDKIEECTTIGKAEDRVTFKPISALKEVK